MKKLSVIVVFTVAFYALVLPYPKACNAHVADPVKMAKDYVEIYKDDPQKVMEHYLNLKKWRQERQNWRGDDLDVYETYLQEQGLIDPTLTKEDFVDDFVFGAIELYKDDPQRYLALYNHYKKWLQEKGFSTLRLDEKYQHLLEPQKEAP